MIPETGWLSESQNTNTEMVDLLLPIEHEGVYDDSSKRGKPIAVFGQRAGSFLIRLENLAVRFRAKIIQVGCHGFGLIDRIE